MDTVDANEIGCTRTRNLTLHSVLNYTVAYLEAGCHNAMFWVRKVVGIQFSVRLLTGRDDLLRFRSRRADPDRL
jgi:hypothetical protein